MIRLFALILVFSTTTVSMYSQETGYEALDLYLKKMTERKMFTGTVLLAKGDSVIFHRAYGPAVATGERMNGTDSQYLIGSITKPVTATAVMQLYEEKKLSLSDPLSKYVSLVPNSENITIRHLLSHRSGIKSYTDLKDISTWKYDELTPAEVVEKVLDFDPMFEPDEMFAYSNTNYVLLGMIIEQVTGKEYAEVIREKILEKAGMNATGMDYDKATRLSEGLTPQNDEWMAEPLVSPSIPFAAGALYSSTSDLLAFSTTFFDEGFFASRSTLDLMKNFDDGYYGIGIYTDQTGDHFFMGHNGGIDGYSSVWKYFEEFDLHLIILSNSYMSALEDISLMALNAFEGKPVEIPAERTTIELPVEKLSRLEGIYEIQKGFNLMVYLEEEKLMARASGQGSFELFAVSDTAFFAKVAPIDINFRLNESGKSEALTLYQGGGSFFSPRIDQSMNSVELSRAELEILEGTYELEQGFQIKIFLDGSHLYSQTAGRDPIKLEAKNRNEFFSLSEGIEITFLFGADGETRGLKLFQGGSSFEATKR
jgi:CubicO group peptidase (beta-lactamase class C family)